MDTFLKANSNTLKHLKFSERLLETDKNKEK